MRTRWVICALAAGLASPAGAIDVANGKLSVSGFGEWGYGKTSNDNFYLLGGPDGEYENAEFGLTVTARPAPDVVVAGQVFWESGGEASLDWAFAEWRLHDLLRIRAGKVKNPLGLFMEVKQVGTLRPFFTLSQAFYGPTNFAAEAYLGAGITGEWQGASGWGVGYDAYGGALEIPSFEPGDAALASPAGPWVFEDHPERIELARDVVGGRVSLLTPLEGLTVRVSAFTGTVTEDDEDHRLAAFALSGEWVFDRLQVRGEWFRATEGSEETHLGGYAEVAWNVLPTLQLALRFDESHQLIDDVPDALAEHHETVLGISYWPSPNLVLRASYHRVEQNRFAVPASSPDGSLDAVTDLYLAGVQFSF
jgi:hypothetical protein